MDAKEQYVFEPRPKRLKDKYNPYSISSAVNREGHRRYFVSFKDVTGQSHTVEINEQLFRAFDDFELEDKRHLNEEDRHYEKSPLTEALINQRADTKPPALEEIVFQKDEIRRSMDCLAETQRRRVKLYFFSSMTLEQIASAEKCSVTAVKNSLDRAIKALKKYFLKGG